MVSCKKVFAFIMIVLVAGSLQAQIKPIAPIKLAGNSISGQIAAKIQEIKSLNAQIKMLSDQLTILMKQQTDLLQQINNLNKKKPNLTDAEKKQLEKAYQVMEQVNKNITGKENEITELVKRRNAAQADLERLQQQQHDDASMLAQLQIHLNKNPSFRSEMTEKDIKAFDYYSALYKNDKNFRELTDLEKKRLEALATMVDDATKDAKKSYDEAKEQFKQSLKILSEHYERASQTVNKISG